MFLPFGEFTLNLDLRRCKSLATNVTVFPGEFDGAFHNNQFRCGRLINVIKFSTYD